MGSQAFTHFAVPALANLFNFFLRISFSFTGKQEKRRLITNKEGIKDAHKGHHIFKKKLEGLSGLVSPADPAFFKKKLFFATGLTKPGRYSFVEYPYQSNIVLIFYFLNNN